MLLFRLVWGGFFYLVIKAGLTTKGLFHFWCSLLPLPDLGGSLLAEGHQAQQKAGRDTVLKTVVWEGL